jgi:DNA-binding LacI/PurR family transcriptional regulator
MTARRAVSELIAMGILERRPWDGIFVTGGTNGSASTNGTPAGPATTPLTVITIGHEPPYVNTLKRLAGKYAQEQGWEAHFIRLQKPSDEHAVRCVLGGGLTLLLVPDDATMRGPVGEAIQQVNGRAALIGNRMDNLGVPSVMADDTQAIGVAIEHLRGKGHTRIGMFCDYTNQPVTSVQVAKWRSAFASELSESDLDRRLIVVDTPRFECPTQYAYERMRQYLTERPNELTALVCTGDESAVAAMSACRDSGYPVPQRMSVVVSGDSSLAAYSNPPLTCVDVDLELHVKLAGDMLARALGGTLPPADRLRLIEPRLVERASVAPLGNP